MNTTANIVLAIFLSGSILLAKTQQQDKDFPLRGIAEREIRQSDLPAFLAAIRANDPYLATAILQAGRTNDRFWVPYLKPLLGKKHRPGLDNDEAGSAQLALAKLGETNQLQEIACEAYYGSASIRYNAFTQKLKYVQGWFAISILTDSIDENPNRNQLLLDRPGDVIYMGPKELALVVLPEIVPNPPFSAPLPYSLERRDEEKLTPQRQAWREWIHKNEESQRKLTPLGAGLDLSLSACKRVLAHDGHFDRSNLQ